MEKKRLLTVIAICIVCAGGVVHAQVLNPFSSIVADLTQQTELIVATLSSFATGQWSAQQSWYTPVSSWPPSVTSPRETK
jgi:hypothetical protein